MIDKKKRILSLLKKEGKPISTTKIATIIRSNNWMTEQYLSQLKDENKIRKIKQISSTYWELNKEEVIKNDK